MNYDLAIMALEGLTRSPLTVRVERGEVVIEGEASAFKELARLCLLIGGTQGGEAVELRPAVHLTKPSPPVRLQLS